MELIPGVQSGQRLTLTGVNDRIGRVEKVVAKLAEDFYGTPDAPITQAEVEKVAIQPSSFVDGGCVTTCLGDCQKPWIDQSDRIRDFEAQVEILTARAEDAETERDEHMQEAEYWQRQYHEVEEALENLRGTLAGLI